MYQKFLRTTLSLVFLSLLFPLVSFSQQNIRVSGKIKDADNKPVAGASVSVKGKTNVGTVAGDDGSYTIEVLPNATLVFTSSGYDPREIAVDNKQEVDVVLNSRASELSDVVVIGYGSRQKKDITGAISTIKPKDIEKSTALSPELAMQGQMAGVDVTSAGGNSNCKAHRSHSWYHVF
jgi:hypothetical protein